jgi:hypothetical protein
MSKAEESFADVEIDIKPEPVAEFDAIEPIEPSPQPSVVMGSVLSSPTLVDALRAFIVNFHPEVAELTEDMKEKYQIVVSIETLSMLQYVLNNYPDNITNIHTQLNAILDDGKINISDVPLVIKLVSSIYNLLLEKKNELKDPSKIVDECSVVLKMSVYVLVKSDNISTGKMSQDEFIMNFNNIVDSCFLIMKPKAPEIVNDVKTHCSKFFRCFSKKK